ncbi:DUF4328 domain-containing protein [Sphaerisporangium album]|uniref:DUF4328 domain-containing protein n=1 Tax=Sphaerisporangium album TaxID=509200 RepID=UPI0015F03D79|nr:DUF4328 domain-containing protein [Sphaerisporangium album]
MPCPQCGFALPSDARRCPTCGRPAGDHAVPAARPDRSARPLQGLTVAVAVTLSAWCAVELFSAAVSLTRVFLINSLLDGEEPSQDALDVNDGLYALSGLMQLCALLACAVVFVVWLFRARANAEALSPLMHRHGRPWFVFGWILPIANFFIPKRFVDDIWLASRPGTPATDWRGQRHPGLVRLWWAFYLLYFYAPQLAERALGLRSDDPGVMRTIALVEVAAAPFGVAAAVLAIATVRRITAFQELRRTAPVAEARLAP